MTTKNKNQTFTPVDQSSNDQANSLDVAALAEQVALLQQQLQQSQQSQQVQQAPAQQPQSIPQPPPTPQISTLPALQGVDTYIAIHRNGLGVQTYLFDVRVSQWRAPTPQESESMVQMFGVPKQVIDAMKNFRF